MIRRTTLLLLFFVLLSVGVLAQKNYKPGSIVLLDGTRKNGLIDYRNWERNPKKIIFRAGEITADEQYTVQQLSSFEVFNEDVYLRAIVWKDMQSVSINNLERDILPAVVDTVFLRTLVKGEKLSLYELMDEKIHYFIWPQRDTLQELQYRLIADADGTNYRAFFTFRDQLKKYAIEAPDQEKLSKEMDRADYTERALVKVITAVNGHSPETVVEHGTKIKKNRFFATGGVMYHDINFAGNADLDLLNESPTLGYSVAAGADFFSRRRFQNLFFRTELRINRSNYKGEGQGTSFWLSQKEKREYELDMMSVSPTVSAMYNILRLKSSRIYLGVGSSYNFTMYNKNQYTTTNLTTNQVKVNNSYLKLQKGWSDFLFNVGYTSKKRLEVRFIHRLSGDFSNHLFMETKNGMSGVMIGYHF